MKIAIYPGSFCPWHNGHEEVLNYALQFFNKVIIGVGYNPTKPDERNFVVPQLEKQLSYGIKNGYVEIVQYDGLLADYISKKNEYDYKIHAVIRGLRNSSDFEYEKIQLYYNQDLGIGIPTMFFISSREKQHVSSSAIRAIRNFRKEYNG